MDGCSPCYWHLMQVLHRAIHIVPSLVADDLFSVGHLVIQKLWVLGLQVEHQSYLS